MSAHFEPEITVLLSAARAGDSTAHERLWRHIDGRIRELAHSLLGGERRSTRMQTTVLCNEAYLRLAQWDGLSAENRRDLFGIIATVMRHVLVDDARKRRRLKRGGGAEATPLQDGFLAVEYDPDRVIGVHEALDQIAREDPDLVRLVELRFFAGRTIADAADLMGISRRQADENWRFVKARLYGLLS